MNLPLPGMPLIVAVGALLFTLPAEAGCARPAGPAIPTGASTPVGVIVPSPAAPESAAAHADWSPEYTPKVRKAEVVQLSPDDLLRRLFTDWLEHFKSADANFSDRLAEFDVVAVEALIEPNATSGNAGSFGGMVRFSVKPVGGSNRWVAGNGRAEGDWIRGKFLFVQVDDDGDSYSLDIVGTGP